MARKARFSVLFTVLLSVSSPITAQTLADTFVAAYQNSNLLEQNRALLRAADEDVAIAVAGLRPVLNFVADARARYSSLQPDSVTASLGLSAEMTLIDFGRGRLGQEAATAQVLATRQALVDIEQRVLLDAASAYMDVRSASEAVALSRATVRVITEELSAARERFELGEITRTDVSLAEARLAGARSNLAAAEGDLAAAREGYKLVTGAYPGQLRPPPALPRTAPSVQVAQDIAQRTHPLILQAQHQVTASERSAEAIAAQRHGSVTASAQINRAFPDRGQNSTTGELGIRYARPLYQGGREDAQTRQALARRDAARSGLHQTVAQISQQVAIAWANVDVASARIAASQQQVRASESAFEGTREEARLGARTTLDVLNAETDLLNARTTLLQAQAAQQIATYNLLSSMGLLTVDHLGLGIPTYDAEAYFNAVRTAPLASPQGEALDRVLRAIGRD
ncbi:MAG: TolC family outer membrane protein [Roseinatronobacter sp.]|nr:TolC family outer membrane protein [Roseinatronobacter sp.]